MSSLQVRVARSKAADHVSIERQRDTCYPCYLVTGPSGKVWLEQPSGRRAGWCVTPCWEKGAIERPAAEWWGDFATAKQMALEYVK